MVLAYHVIFACYGFWLPNDPRGSWSDFVRSYELYQHGAATKTDTRRSVASATHDRQARLDAKRTLRHSPVRLTGEQARCVGMGFGEQVRKSAYVAYACCVMPDHVHLVLGRGSYPVEQMVNLLKGAATRRLAIGRSPWAQGLWKVFLNTAQDIERAIGYVEDNPIRAGLKGQRWSFVIPYETHRPSGGRSTMR